MKVDQAYLKYITSKKVLIVDRSVSRRSMMARSLTVLGFRVNQVFAVETLAGARRIIETEKPRILITEFSVFDELYLSLIQKIKTYEPKQNQRLILLMTSQPTESSLAQAAEEEVDGYLLHPFHHQKFEKYFYDLIQRKIYPNEYQKLILSGKKALETFSLDQAMSFFEKAKVKTEKPTLAWFYLAETFRQKHHDEKAIECYQKGLALDPSHFKCLQGVFDTYLHLGRIDDAYRIATQIARQFPLTPEKLKLLIELCIRTQNYDDVIWAYQLFQKIEDPDVVLKKTLSVALVTSGAFHLEQKKTQQAKSYFKLALRVSYRKPVLIQKIIDYCIHAKEVEMALEFLESFRRPDLNSVEYRIAHYRVFDATHSVGQSISKGRQLLKEGIVHPAVFEILIKRTLDAGFADTAEHLLHQAIRAFPSERNQFEKRFRSLAK